jgi:hypothetical protein
VARGFGKKTVAEFVEDERALNLLRAFGVDYAQGYFIGKPAPDLCRSGRVAGRFGLSPGGSWRRCYNRLLTCHSLAYRLPRMALFTLGINHHTAPLSVREQVAFHAEGCSRRWPT